MVPLVEARHGIEIFKHKQDNCEKVATGPDRDPPSGPGAALHTWLPRPAPVFARHPSTAACWDSELAGSTGQGGRFSGGHHRRLSRDPTSFRSWRLPG